MQPKVLDAFHNLKLCSEIDYKEFNGDQSFPLEKSKWEYLKPHAEGLLWIWKNCFYRFPLPTAWAFIWNPETGKVVRKRLREFCHPQVVQLFRDIIICSLPAYTWHSFLHITNDLPPFIKITHSQSKNANSFKEFEVKAVRVTDCAFTALTTKGLVQMKLSKSAGPGPG